jgi:hypothetical protein
MKGRFSAFLAVITLFGWFPYLVNESHVPRSTGRARRDAPLLVPAVLGSYRAVNRWSIVGNGTIEQGALYSNRSTDGPVQLDMFLNYPGPHNGIACYLAQGFSLSSKGLQRLKSSDGEGQFQVAVLRTDDLVKATASTECWSWGCQETPVGTWSLVLSLAEPPSVEMPIPITVTADDSELSGDGEQQEARLLRRLDTFIAQLDLARIERFAGEQSKP